MNIDKNQLRTVISRSKPADMLVLSVNSVENDSLGVCHKNIDKFVRKSDDYTVIVIKR